MSLFRGTGAVGRISSATKSLARVKFAAILIAMVVVSMSSAFNVSSVSASHGGTVVCDTGGTEHCYQWVTTQANWPDAKLAAEGMMHNGVSGHLATLTSATENQFIVDEFDDAISSFAYFGGYRIGTTGNDWAWVTGELWDNTTYENFADGEPTLGSHEDVTEFFHNNDHSNSPTSLLYLGHWNDQDGDTSRTYLVEFDDPFVPSTVSTVDTWDPIVPDTAYPSYPTQPNHPNGWQTTVCVPTPEVGLNADWENPHKAFEFGDTFTNGGAISPPDGTGHPWQPAIWNGGLGYKAQWINSWSNVDSNSSGGPTGDNWTKYSTSVTGTGEHVLNLLADNCSWIYIDDVLVGFQGATTTPPAYPVQLSGTHDLEFIIFDEGGQAGGMFDLVLNNGSVTFPDFDNDGLTDAAETLLGTDIDDVDTDGDGFEDGDEVEAGTDPLVNECRTTSASSGIDWIAAPASVANEALVDDDHLRFFYERDTTVPAGGLAVDITSPGAYTGSLPLSPGVIPAGTSVVSCFLHLDRSIGGTAHGEITFDAGYKVAGIIVTEDELNATDTVSVSPGLLGAPGTLYVNDPNSIRGTVEGGADYLILSPDRKTIKTTFAVGTNYLDQARITLVADSVVLNVDPVVAVDDASVDVDEGSVAGNTGTVTDGDNDTVSLSVPAGMGSVVNNNDGTWAWTGEGVELDDDTYNVTITANDGNGGTDEVVFTVNVDNVDPTVGADNASVTVDEGSTALNAGTFNDPGDDDVTFTASVGSVSKSGWNSGTWSWEFDTSDGPDDSQTVTITADDGDGGVSEVEFDLVVSNVVPTFTVTGDEIDENEFATVSGTISDPGVNDSFKVEIHWGEGDIETFTYPAGSASFSETHQYIDDGTSPGNLTAWDNYVVTVKITDDMILPVGHTWEYTFDDPTVVDPTWNETTGGWVTAPAPFATCCSGTGFYPATIWPADTNNDDDLWVRTSVDLTGVDLSDVVWGLGVDNGFKLYANGTLVDSGDASGGTHYWEYSGDFDGDLVPGVNVIAVALKDYGGATAFDMVVAVGSVPNPLKTAIVKVKNVVPSITVVNSTVTVDEGQPANNSGTFGDVEADVLSLSLSPEVGTLTDEGDGDWSWSLGTDDGPSEGVTLTVTVSDDDLGQNSIEFDLVVDNLPPTATFGNGGGVPEGTAGSVEFSSESDPSDADEDAGLRYSYDFDNNGSFDSGNGTYAGSSSSASVAVPASFLSDGDDDVTVLGRIIDKDGGYSEYTTVIHVSNVAPTITIDTIGTDENGKAEVSGVITDPGNPEAFYVVINWGGTAGTSVAAVTGTTTGATYWAEHQYKDDNPSGSSSDIYPISVTIIDGDGGSGGASSSLTVTNLPPVIDDSTVGDFEDFDIYSGETFAFSIDFDDVGTMDTHGDVTTTVDWGAGAGPVPTTVTQGVGGGTVSDSHQYFVPDEYTVTVVVTDDDDGTVSTTFEVLVRYIPIDIDVKPGSDVNPLNLNGNGVVPIAVLGDADFDVSILVASSVKAGVSGSEAAPYHNGHIELVNGDTHPDYVFHFREWELGIDPYGVAAGDIIPIFLRALDGDGRYFEGVDTVRINPNNGNSKDKNDGTDPKKGGPKKK